VRVMNDRTTIDLASAASAPSTAVGGKAEALARLRAAGFPTPDGVVVASGATDDEVLPAATAIAGRFAGRALAVRSSGVSEDLADASFAGQYVTVLNVLAEAAPLAAAIRQVRASAHAAHLGAYGHGVDDRMAVLVMPMVEADTAGIAFTRHPVTGADEVVIEAVPGLGDRLAAGEVDPESWTVADVATCETNRHDALSSDQASAIADLARRVEAHEGTPQDIEWAYAGGDLMLLQARPITTGDDVEPVPFDDPIPDGPWTLDSTHSRTPATPLIASMFPEAFRRGSTRLSAEYGIPFERLEIRCINGWWYVQVVPPGGKHRPLPPKPIFQALTRLHPWFRKQNKTAQEAIAADLPAENLRVWETEIRPPHLESIARWARLDLADLDTAALGAHIGSVTAAAQDVFAWNMVTDASYLIPLSDLIEAGTKRWGMSFADVIGLVSGHSTSEYRDALSELAADLADDEPARLVITEGGPDLLGRLDRGAPDFAAAYRAHLDRYGLRVLGFDLDSPTIIEHPEIELSRLLDFELGEPVSPPAPHGVSATDLAEYERLLAKARATYPIREDGESLNAATWGALRLAALETGRRMVGRGDLEAPEHALMLTVDELGEWLAEPTDSRDTVRVRRGQRVWAMINPPPATLGPENTPPEAGWFPAGIRSVYGAMSLVMAHDMGDADIAPGADGVAGSSGIHTGPVRVVHSPAEFAKVHRGDVLVCPITASPWEVLFPDIGGLITEGGGVLSHPAIVAREHGIPAVLAVADATSRFSDGQIVTVDGTAGTVTLHEG